MTLAYVFIGGGLGAASRWLVANSIKVSSGFPWATLSVNLMGCFLIGIASYYALKGNHLLMSLGIIGFLGGFTTFSSYGLDLMRLLESGATKHFVIYFLTSNVLGLLLVYLGHKLATNYFG